MKLLVLGHPRSGSTTVQLYLSRLLGLTNNREALLPPGGFTPEYWQHLDDVLTQTHSITKIFPEHLEAIPGNKKLKINQYIKDVDHCVFVVRKDFNAAVKSLYISAMLLRDHALTYHEPPGQSMQLYFDEKLYNNTVKRLKFNLTTLANWHNRRTDKFVNKTFLYSEEVFALAGTGKLDKQVTVDLPEQTFDVGTLFEVDK
jgi:hypothetical protein